MYKILLKEKTVEQIKYILIKQNLGCMWAQVVYLVTKF